MNKKQLAIWLLFFIGILILCLLILRCRRRLEGFESNTCVLYKLHHTSGFFSDFFFLLEMYIRAKKAGYDFFIDSTEWSYKYNKGWYDYFTESSLKEITNSIRSKYTSFIECEHISTGQDKYEHAKKLLGESSLNLNDYILAIQEVFKLNPYMLQKVQTYTNAFGVYDAVYIRRGDKISTKESPFISTEEIMKQVTINQSILYVQTDDYTEVENIKKLFANKEIKTITPETQRGANESERKTITPDELRKSTEELLIGVVICSNAESCWVDISSNVSRFIKLYGKNVKFYKIGREDIDYTNERPLDRNPAYAHVFLKDGIYPF